MRGKFFTSLFVSSVIIVSVIGCNNASDKTAEQKMDTPVDIIDTSSVVIKSVPVDPKDPYSLNTDELQDDSIFSDGSKTASWKVAGIDSPIAFKHFIKRLQHWVINNQKDSVASVIGYPMHNPPVKNKKDFLINYDLYFNNKVKSALKEQKLRQIFRNNSGAMIGKGNLWFSQTPNGFRIIGINYK